MSQFEIYSLLISLLAVVVAFVSLFRSRKISEKQIALQEAQELLAKRQLELAEMDVSRQERANLTVKLKRAESGQFRFHIINSGPSVARNVEFFVEPELNQPRPLSNDYYEVFPVAELHPGDEVSVIAALADQTGSTINCELYWKDATNCTDRRQVIVTL